MGGAQVKRITIPAIVLVLLCGLLVACSSSQGLPALEETPVPSQLPPTATTLGSGGETPVPSTPPALQPWGTFGPSFMKDGITFEASAYSRESCVTVRVDLSGPIETLGSIQYSGLGPIGNIDLVDGDTGLLLRVRLTGRGGGGGGDDNTIGMSQDYTYEVLSPLPVTRLMAVVTFDPALGISAPSRFDLAVIPRETLFCPQLPPTTPEG